MKQLSLNIAKIKNIIGDKYLNLRSDIDPTEMRYRIRQAMYDAGFGMVEESDKGYNQPAYDTATRQYTVQWTWCIAEPV